MEGEFGDEVGKLHGADLCRDARNCRGFGRKGRHELIGESGKRVYVECRRTLLPSWEVEYTEILHSHTIGNGNTHG